MTIKRVINFSGGLCSFWAAHRVISKYGKENVTLLFADTLIEDPDLYVFNLDAAHLLGVPITVISTSETPWSLFRRKGMMGTSRYPLCSVILKREPLDAWQEANCYEMDTILYLGFDWTEAHRLEALRQEKPAWRIEAPMIEEPIWDKCRMQIEAEKIGLTIPKLYLLGFPHNNCGGRCVRAGITHWVKLLELLPERFMEWEREELATRIEFERRGISTEWATILKDRRGGVKAAMTLQALRHRVEGGESFPSNDWGGCGCGGAKSQ